MISASPADTPTPAPAKSPGRLGLILEMGLMVAVLVGTKLIFDQIVWKYAGPISLAITLGLLAIITARRGESWSAFGLRRLKRWWSWPLVLPQGLLCMVGILAAGAGTAFAGDALGLWSIAEGEAGVEARFGDIVGNLPVYLGWLALAWTSAAFGEEIFFRGYVIDRLTRILPSAKWASILAVVISALGFGLVHMYYQGLRGLIATGLIGLALGLLYLGYKRNIWPLILAHGAVDTLSFTAFYLDLDI